MKTKRILATLLCVMMVLTCIPAMMLVSATETVPTDIPYAAVGKVLGGEYSEAHPGTKDWGAMNLVFTDNFSASAEGVTVPTGMTFSNENGAVMPLSATAAPFYYKSSVAYQNYWSPMNLGNWGFRFKLEEGGTFVAQAVLGWSVTRAYVTFKNNEVTTWALTDGSTKVADFVPGTDWNDALIVTKADKTYDVYMKKATDSEFTKVWTVTDAQTASTGNWRVGAEITGNGYALQNSISYQLADAPAGGGSDDNTGGGNDTTDDAAPGVTTELRSAIGTVLGAAYADPATSSSDWAAMNLEFTGTFDASQDGMNTGTGITYDAEMGAVLKYRPTCKHNGWSPLCVSNNYSFGFKLKADGTLNQQSPQIWANNRTFMDITPTGVTIYDGGEGGGGQRPVEKLVDYQPGTEWNDVMVTTNTAGGYTVYMKKATDAAFTKVAETPNYRVGGGAWGSAGFTVDAKNVYVSYAVSWVGADAPAGGGEGGGNDNTGSQGNGATPTTDDFNAAGEALGKVSIVPVDGLAFDFVGAGTSYEQPEGVKSTSGYTYVAEGLTFGETQGVWYYYPETKWCSFSYGPAIYFKAKVEEGGSLIPQAYWPSDQHYRMYYTITPTGAKATGASGVTIHDENFKPGTGYVEYMMFKDTADNGNTQILYAKGGNVTEWTKIVSATTWRTGSNNTGLSFSANKTVIPYMAVVTTTNSSQGGGGNTPSGDAYDGTQGNIKNVLGDDAVIIQDIQFSSDFDKQMAGVTVPAASTFDDGKGLQLPANGQFQYLPQSGYTPLAYKGLAVGVKAGGGDSAIIQLKNPVNNSDRTYVQITQTSIWVCQGNGEGGFAGCPNLVEYVPGADWNDYLTTVNDQNGYNVYAKPQGDADWTLVCSTTSYRPGGSVAMGLQLYSATGSSWFKYASVYGTQDQLPEPEGPEAGTKMTIEDIIGGIAVAKEELIFDSNFNGIEANAQLKNVQSGEVAEEQPTVGANGLELVQTAGKYFAWNSGTVNSWKPLTKENPVMFRAKLDAGSMLDVQLNANPRASIYLYPEKLIVQGTSQTQAPDFAPGTGWVNYLVTRDASNFMVWTKLDGETEWTLRVTSNGFRTAGFYGMLFANTTANKVTLSEVKQYKIERMVLTDANTIATMTNRVFIDEDFSENLGVHNMITGKIEDGVFKRDPEAEPHASYPNSSRLDVDLSQVNPKGQWFVSFKYLIPTADAVMSCDMVNNGNKIAIDCHDDYVFIINRTSGVGKSDTAAAAGVGNWAELLFAWTDNAYVDVYWHKVGDDEWIKTHTKFVPGSEANDKLAFHCTRDAELDDVKVYSGDYLKVDEPVLESGLVKTSGEYFSGTLESKYDRRATLITAVYDSTYGYTKFVKAKDYEVLSGRGANLANTFVTEGVDETKDAAAVMLWDTLKTGIPLGDMAGVVLKNNATGAPKKDALIGVTAEANYNDVRVTGYTGIKNGRVTISVVDESGVLKAVGQTTSSGTGLVDASVAVDPSSATGTYIVRVQYGTTEATASTVELFCDDIPYNTITDVASMRSFINNYGSETAKKWNTEESFAADVYARFLEEKGSITTFATLYDFRDVMDVATDSEIHERQFCLDVNNAAKAGKWSEVQDLVLDGTLGVTIADLSGISDKKALFMRMTGGYTSEPEVLAGFQTALAAQKTAEAAGGAGAGGGGGAGGGIAADNKYTQTGAGVSGGGGGFGGGSVPQPVEKPIEFTDLENVSWAKESIQALKSMGIVNGTGDGTFSPDRAVTREEFLKMILQAAGITAKADGEVAFRDVDAGAWYYDYVVTAYKIGIINGMSDEEFGIGQQITRSDMAVIIKRVMDYNNVEVEKKVAAYVFSDFETIPEYARESVDALAQAQLMNGKGNKRFEGGASATRAESAVAIYRIYNYMVERR